MWMLRDRENSELDKMFDAMDAMFRSYWTLPDELVSEDVKWVHRVTSTDPHDAVRAGTRTLATVGPKVTLHPLLDNEESRDTANEVEKALEWIFMLASRRPGVNLLRDIVLSALLYDEVVVSTWSLPYQEKLSKALGNDTKRLKASRRYGDFFIKVHNPRDVVVEYSDLMAERVLIRSVIPVAQLADEWGSKHEEIKANLDTDRHRYATVYDFHEIGYRCVFAFLQEDHSTYQNIRKEGAIVLVDENTPYDFLPFSAKIGGTSLTLEERYRRIPLLWSIYNSGQWDTQNILETLLVSEGLAYSVSPRYAVENEFDNGEVPDVDFRKPARIVNLRRGQRLQDLRPPQLNNGLELLSDRIASRMDKSTVPRVLQSGDYPSGSAFASLNLATQSGMKSLTPYKELAEQALTDMFVNILNWISFTGEPMEAYIPKNVVREEEEAGFPSPDFMTRKVEIDTSYFDPERIYLSVELTEDAPTDFVAKVNAGAMLVERLGGSYQKALEFTGETDPGGVMKLREAENLRLAENQRAQKEIINQADLGLIRMQEDLQKKLQEVEQMKMQLQEIMAQAQQGGPPMGAPGGPGVGPQGQPMPGQDGSMPPQMQRMLAMRRGQGPGPGPNEGMFPGGPGADPSMGGMPPAMGAPGEGLREETQMNEGE